MFVFKGMDKILGENFAIDPSSDAIDQSIFDWLLSNGPQVDDTSSK